MENTGNLKYLKGIIVVFLVFYVLFILMNLFEGLLNGGIMRLPGKSDSKVMMIEGNIHYWLNITDYILQFVFLLMVNQFVRKHQPGKGVHFLLVIVAFIPVINYVLLYIVWRKLNKQLFSYFGNNPAKSDRKIVALWILILAGIVVALLTPAFIYYSDSPESVSSVDYYTLYFGQLVKPIYLLLMSVLYLSYYLEVKRMLDRADSGMDIMNHSPLLDD